jgi:hypothetical protein
MEIFPALTPARPLCYCSRFRLIIRRLADGSKPTEDAGP